MPEVPGFARELYRCFLAATLASALAAAACAAEMEQAALYSPHKPGEPTRQGPASDVPAAAPVKRPFRSDEFEISLRSPDAGPHVYETEFKLRMNSGDAVVYSWSVENLSDPEEFFFDFHGEYLPEKGKPEERPVSYEKDTGGARAGYLVAPFAGAHGWYFQNQSGVPVVVHLKVSGFYELIYPGEFGNEAGILPKR